MHAPRHLIAGLIETFVEGHPSYCLQLEVLRQGSCIGRACWCRSDIAGNIDQRESGPSGTILDTEEKKKCREYEYPQVESKSASKRGGHHQTTNLAPGALLRGRLRGMANSILNNDGCASTKIRHKVALRMDLQACAAQDSAELWKLSLLELAVLDVA